MGACSEQKYFWWMKGKDTQVKISEKKLRLVKEKVENKNFKQGIVHSCTITYVLNIVLI